MRSHVLLLVVLGGICACSQVTVFGHKMNEDSRSAAPAGAAAIAPAQQSLLRVARITLEFTQEAQRQTDADVRFDRDVLRDAILTELRTRGMLDQDSPTGRVAVIRIDEFEVRATTNVVLFGYLPSAGTLAGSMRVREAAGGTLPDSQLRAEVQMNIAQRDTDKDPLQNLYRRFAVLAADDLACQVAALAATQRMRSE